MKQEIVQQALAVLAKHDQCSAEYDVAVFALHHAIRASHGESLMQLVEHGPIWDGDVISKSRRDDLIRWRLATRVCVKGEQGFTAATYRGWAVHYGGLKPRPEAKPILAVLEAIGPDVSVS